MTIYLDPFRLLPSNGAFKVSDELTYVEARRRMMAFKRGLVKEEPIFVVHNYPYLAWFDDLPEEVKVSISPRSKLSELYPSIVLPNDLTDSDVIALNLLDGRVEPTTLALRKYFFGMLLNRVEANSDTLLALALFVRDHPTVFQKNYLKRIWADCLKSLPEVMAPLREGNKDFSQALAEGIYMAGIPALLTDWEHSYAAKFKSRYGILIKELMPFIRWTRRSFPEDEDLEVLLIKRLREHLKAGENVPNAILPGIYRAELEILIAQSTQLTSDQGKQLEEKYANVLTDNLRQQLQMLVTPTLDPAPIVSGLSLPEQANAWQAWAISSFIPYKFWLDKLNVPTIKQLEQVEQQATAFGDWLYVNYPALLAQNSILTNYDVRKRVLDSLQAGKSRVIWFIIDGFPSAFVSLLEQQLREYGLIRQVTHYAFAPLPTITDVGIPVLLNGLTPDSSGFTDDRREALRRAFPGQTSVFASVVGQFKEALESDADLCCLHWQEIDKTMHLDDNEFDSPTARVEKIRRLLKERIGMLASAINSQTDRPTKVIISTDHGATKCLRNGKNIKNQRIADAAAANPRERSVKLEGKLLSVHLDDSETYHLTSEITRNPDSYVAARGYCYFKSNDRGYRHGGLTPEEVIVPILEAEMAAFAVEPLQVSYYGNNDGLPQGKTLKDFRVQVRNSNPFAIEILRLVLKEDTNAQFELPIKIDTSSSGVLRGIIKIPQKYKSQNGHLELNATVVFRANAEEFSEVKTIAVPIQSTEIDDFFDF